MKTNKTGLAVFLRYPQPGLVKTRLGQVVGMESAAALYEQMVALVLEIGLALPKTDWNLYAFCDPDHEMEKYERWLGPYSVRLLDQRGNSPSHRIRDAISFMLDENQSAIVIGVDCVELTESSLEKARQDLREDDIVLGATREGGQYLIGMNNPHPELFDRMSWGTNKITLEVLNRARELRLRVTELPVLSDLETMEDLKEFSMRIAQEKNRD